MWMLASSTSSYCDAKIYGGTDVKSKNTPLGTQVGNGSLDARSIGCVKHIYFNDFFSSTSFVYDLGKKGPKQESNTSKTAQLLCKGRSDVNYQWLMVWLMVCKFSGGITTLL